MWWVIVYTRQVVISSSDTYVQGVCVCQWHIEEMCALLALGYVQHHQKGWSISWVGPTINVCCCCHDGKNEVWGTRNAAAAAAALTSLTATIPWFPPPLSLLLTMVFATTCCNCCCCCCCWCCWAAFCSRFCLRHCLRISLNSAGNRLGPYDT